MRGSREFKLGRTGALPDSSFFGYHAVVMRPFIFVFLASAALPLLTSCGSSAPKVQVNLPPPALVNYSGPAPQQDWVQTHTTAYENMGATPEQAQQSAQLEYLRMQSGDSNAATPIITQTFSTKPTTAPASKTTASTSASKPRSSKPSDTASSVAAATPAPRAIPVETTPAPTAHPQIPTLPPPIPIEISTGNPSP